MVYGKKEYFISRYAIRNAIKSHGHEDRINPDLIKVVVRRLDKLLDEWITEALRRMKEEGRKTVLPRHLQAYFDERDVEIEALKEAKCGLCGKQLEPDDLCIDCVLQKFGRFPLGYNREKWQKVHRIK